jgi:hypothetical protein
MRCICRPEEGARAVGPLQLGWLRCAAIRTQLRCGSSHKLIIGAPTSIQERQKRHPCCFFASTSSIIGRAASPRLGVIILSINAIHIEATRAAPSTNLCPPKVPDHREESQAVERIPRRAHGWALSLHSDIDAGWRAWIRTVDGRIRYAQRDPM